MDPLIELRKPAGSQDEKNSKTAKDERTKHSARKSYRKHKTKPGKEDLSHNERQKINSSSFPALGSPAVNEDDDNGMSTVVGKTEMLKHLITQIATSKPSRASVPKLEKSLRREPGKSDCGKMAVLPDVGEEDILVIENDFYLQLSQLIRCSRRTKCPIEHLGGKLNTCEALRIQ